jgi:chaperonin GroES
VKFIPLYERVLVQEMEGAKTVGEFAVPDTAREDFKIGVVISTGAGYRKENGDLVPMTVRQGMTVLFGPHAGTIVQVDNQPFLSMKEGEIIGWMCFKNEGKPCGACPECT